MNLFSKIWDVITSIEFEQTSTVQNDINNHLINPSTGLQMCGSVDMGGNAFGTNFLDHHRSSTEPHHFNNSANNYLSTFSYQSQNYSNINSPFNNPFNNY